MAAELSDIVAFCARLTDFGVEHTLGGSGLMRCRGIDIGVQDWDVVTDDPEQTIVPAIDCYESEKLEPVFPFASDFTYRLRVGSSDVDLIGGFWVYDIAGTSIVRCRSLTTGHYSGIPLGDLGEWRKVYAALGETHKVALLREMP